jgi:hypothetical protein
MSKFKKRVFKSGGSPLNALVVGTGFGRLEEITEMFKTVFVIADEYPEIRLKNVIFREDAFRLDLLSDVKSVFIDLDRVDYIENLEVILQRHTPDVFIEGNDVIDRDKSKLLWKIGYRAVDQQGLFHTWKRIG